MLQIVIATRNRHKFRELKSLLPRRGVRWRSLAEFPRAASVAEGEQSFEANAVKKARAAARATGCLALADDSGLEVDALGGLPGVTSARFAGRHGDDTRNTRKLLQALEGVATSRRRARYRCALALASPTRLLAVVHGTWEGRIATAPAGRNGFGYDPVFVVLRFNRTVGQLPPRLKQRLSHRAAAARRLRSILERFLRATARGH